MFKKKKEDNKNEDFEWFDPKAEWEESQEELEDELEENDVLALILSGFLVLGPIILILIIILALLF